MNDDYSVRERDFHNKRFSLQDGARAEDRFYVSVINWKRRTHAEILNAACGNILEIGSGTGGNVQAILDRSACKYVGIDISDVAVAACQEKFKDYKDKVSFRCMDANHLDFKDNDFNFVFGMGVLHHLKFKTAVSEIRRVLSENGQAVFGEPLDINPLIRLYRYLTPNSRSPDERPLCIKDLEILRMSFSEVEIEYFGLFTLLAAPFGFSKLGITIFKFFEKIDNCVLKIPYLRYLSWMILIKLKK